jgi:DNA polymerase-1
MSLMQSDFSQAELRAMAALSGDVWMLEALQEGQADFFEAHMLPVCYPGVDRSGWDKQTTKDNRAKVKAVQYGLAFDRGARAIAESLGLPLVEAQAIIDNYLNTAKQFAAWRQDIKKAAVTPALRDMLVSPTGRRFQSEIITSKNAAKIQREALSFLPQATASDMTLITAIRIHDQVKQTGSHIVALVHDAILVEAPDDDTATMLGKFVSLEMRKTGEMFFDSVPFLAEWSIGNDWGSLK